MKEEYDKTVQTIIRVNEELCSFWGSAQGWAPIEASDLMSKSRLDRQVSLSKSLYNWSHLNESKEGDLILAWVNLGSLIEGTMKLFLSVFLSDYKNDQKDYLHKNGKKVYPNSPDTLSLGMLKGFFRDSELFKIIDPPIDDLVQFRSNAIDAYKLIDLVQSRRNAIHAYEDKNIGNFKEFKNQVDNYLSFLRDVNKTLPYPD